MIKPYTATYNFTKAKRVNPDMVIRDSDESWIAVIPRNGNQKRQEENAAKITRALNCHDDLVAALAGMCEMASHASMPEMERREIMQTARIALAKARES